MKFIVFRGVKTFTNNSIEFYFIVRYKLQYILSFKYVDQVENILYIYRNTAHTILIVTLKCNVTLIDGAKKQEQILNFFRGANNRTKLFEFRLLPTAREGNVSQVSACPQSASWLLVHCLDLLQCGRYASYWNAFLFFTFTYKILLSLC